jgi:hypothetical protein
MNRRRYGRRYWGTTSKISWEKSNSPGPRWSAVNEKDSVRISTLATLVEVTTFPIHGLPGPIVVEFIQIAIMRGGAFGWSVCAVGHTEGAMTTRAGSRLPLVIGEHPMPMLETAIARLRRIIDARFAADVG